VKLDFKSTNKAEATENIYLKARMAASAVNSSLRVRGIAAEELHVSVDSLFNYENGKTVPNEDMVFNMAELYGDQMLIVEHFMQSRTGQFLKEKFGLDCQTGELSQATLGFIKGHKHIDLERLIAVAWDGEITSEEKRDARLLETNVSFLVRQSIQLLWALQENRYLETERQTKVAPEKPKTALQSGSRRKFKYAV
jgi:hypothetical protein